MADNRLRVPVVSDENGTHVKMPPTPTDSSFRRALYIFLVVIGLMAGGSLVASRANGDDLAAARDGREAAERQRSDLKNQISDLIEQEKQNIERTRALERLIFVLLANSDDPETREAFRQLARELGIDPDVSPSSITLP